MAFLGGQFKSATHGQFKSAQGGQFDRLLQSDSQGLTIRLKINELGCKEIQRKTLKIYKILASPWRETKNTYKSTL